jgi:hypothetical protein
MVEEEWDKWEEEWEEWEEELDEDDWWVEE